MEVTRSNFVELLPIILARLETASFVSFDAEYTGLKSSEGCPTLFDSTSDRYNVLRSIIQSNSAPQFGIAIFHRVKDSSTTHQVYTVDAYSFYLMEPCFADFNMTGSKGTVEVDCNPFLNSIGFDFEKWFMKSVPFLNDNMSKELERYLKANPDFMEQCKEKGRYLDDVLFPEFNPLLTEEDQKELVKKLRGFAAIVDVISSRKIPVVGHNMAQDLMYFFNNFCVPLPEKYSDFKQLVRKYLPIVYDTKFMTVKCRKMLDHPSLVHSRNDIAQLQCSGLYIIYRTSFEVQDKFSPEFNLLDSCKYFDRDLRYGKLHELEGREVNHDTLCHQPSFDACVTGMVFLQLGHIACRVSKEFLFRSAPPDMDEVFFHINQWSNQIYVSRATVMTMCLQGEDPRPNRSWALVTFTGEGEVKADQMFRLLKSDTEFRSLLDHGVDYSPIATNQVLLAFARIQTCKDLSARLKRKGFLVEKIEIPWDKKRLNCVRGITKDNIYDSGRNTFFC